MDGEDLSKEELKRLLPPEADILNDTFIGLNSTSLQKQLNEIPGAGREIGNMYFYDEKKEIIEPPKFMEILEILKKQEGKSIFYSNYDRNGFDCHMIQIINESDEIVVTNYQKRIKFNLLFYKILIQWK